MPVIILVGDKASEYTKELEIYFENKYRVQILTCPYASVRSFLSNQSESDLYVVPFLSKPERYEIFCLARKNEQKFISIAQSVDDLVSSDKNPLALANFDGRLIEAELDISRVAKTTANTRSKGVSLRGLRDVKNMIKHVNEEHYNGSPECILKECEERLIKAWGMGLSRSTEELEKCYCQMVNADMDLKGLLKNNQPSTDKK